MPRRHSQTGDDPKLQISLELDNQVTAQAGKEKRAKAHIFNRAVKRALDAAEAEQKPLDHPTHFGGCRCLACAGKVAPKGRPVGLIRWLPQRGCADSSAMPWVALIAFLAILLLASKSREPIGKAAELGPELPRPPADLRCGPDSYPVFAGIPPDAEWWCRSVHAAPGVTGRLPEVAK